MADMITRCPKCSTAFRISEALLKSAKGIVRCGSCLDVFNAKDHIELRPEFLQPAQALINPELKPSMVKNEANTTSANILAKEELISKFANYEDDNDDDALDENDEDAWALELLKDDEDTPSPQLQKIVAKTPEPTEDSETTRDWAVTMPTIGGISPEASPPEPLSAYTPLPDSETTSVLAHDLIENVETTVVFEDSIRAPIGLQQNTDTTQQIAAPTDELVAPPLAIKTDATTASLQETPGYTEQEDNARLTEENESSPEDEPELPPPSRLPIRPKLKSKPTAPLDNVIAALENEPLEMTWQAPLDWKKKWLWPGLSLLALLCLLIQVAWLQYPKLNKVEPYRSFYQTACYLLRCELPKVQDRTQISTHNLVVRSHPKLANALQIDVILQNNAEFTQAFPKLELVFTDVKNQTVATRLLTPQEYLGGELTGATEMPTKKPIHIGIELADPGAEALGYHISIVD